MSLQCPFWGSDTGRTFDLLVDGHKVATQPLTGAQPNGYLYASYSVPGALTRGKRRVTVRFTPQTGSWAGGLFGLRVMRTG